MLTIKVRRTSDVAVVKCAGRLVRGEAVRSLRQAVVSENDTRIVMLDLADVKTLDAGGLTALLSLHQWCWERNVQLKLVNPSLFVQKVLTLTQLDRILDISLFDHTLFVPNGSECQGLTGATDDSSIA
jgi:anti-anti-sigma factor